MVEAIQLALEDGRLRREGRPAQAPQIYEILVRDHGYEGSYQAVVRHLELFDRYGARRCGFWIDNPKTGGGKGSGGADGPSAPPLRLMADQWSRSRYIMGRLGASRSTYLGAPPRSGLVPQHRGHILCAINLIFSSRTLRSTK